jgi:hypothetical protein
MELQAKTTGKTAKHRAIQRCLVCMLLPFTDSIASNHSPLRADCTPHQTRVKGQRESTVLAERCENC